MKRKLTAYIAIVSLLLVVASASHAEFVRNGGFEVGGNIVDFKALGRPAAFQNYEIPADWLLNSPHGGGGYRHSGGHDGQRYWYTGGWYMLRQHIGGLELGKTYMISYYGKGINNPGHQPRLRFYWNGAVQFNLDGSDTSGRWTHYSRTFTVTEEEVTGGMIWLNSLLNGGYAAHFDD
ncbi:MAG: hypothetical protein QF662_01330, partial [Phycisphaerae bacterium]|nr:hypothetical protein [Phycisphaerae bacterium]